MNTGEAVLARLASYQLKQEANGEWRCNSPLRPGANSHSFTVRIETDGEHGAFSDHAGGDSGSLYDLADRLGIERPKSERAPVGNSKRAYKNLAEYAEFKGVPESVFITAKWSREPVTYDKRPALKFPTQGGDRYRFVDGNKPAFKSCLNYKACWYGLKTAVGYALKNSLPLILCNGEPSVIVATHYKVSACAITGGEQPTIPEALLTELKKSWNGAILIAMDCDEAGRKAAAGKAKILRAVGYTVTVIDLGLGESGDLADFCKLHTDGTMTVLLKLAQDAPKSSVEGSNSSAVAIPVITRAERLSNYITRLNDYDSPRAAVPVPFPLTVLHKFGGMAQVIKPGKMLGIVGVSGGGKTSLIETLLDLWLPYDVPCLAWSPEWTPDEFVERAVQRYGGPRTDELYRHEIFIDEQQRGIKKGFGRELNAGQMQEASKAVAKLRGFQTQIGYLDMPLLTVSHLQNSIEATLRKLDFKPRILALDYIQLLAALEPGNVQMYDLLMRVKSVATAYGMIPVIASQVTKTSAKGQSNGRMLDAMDARYVNDDAFNLFITINPDRDPMGDFKPSAVLNIAKNSMGEKGKVRIPANWERLSFGDTLHFNQSFDDDKPTAPPTETPF